MKIRAGFVSNSSSSMFVVAFPHVPKSAKEVQEILFGDKLKLDNPYDGGVTKTDLIADTVWNDIKPQKRWKEKTRINRVSEAVRGGWLEGQPKYENFRITPNHIKELEYAGKPVLIARVREQTDWKAYEKACDKYAQEMVDILLNDWVDRVIYVFGYGDNDGDYYSTLEHGGIFNNLPHKQISWH